MVKCRDGERDRAVGDRVGRMKVEIAGQSRPSYTDRDAQALMEPVIKITSSVASEPCTATSVPGPSKSLFVDFAHIR